MVDQPISQAAPEARLPTPPRTRGLPLVGALPALVRGSFDFMLEAQA